MARRLIERPSQAVGVEREHRFTILRAEHHVDGAVVPRQPYGFALSGVDAFAAARLGAVGSEGPHREAGMPQRTTAT